MSNIKKNQERILEKLKIEKLNAMQEEAKLAIHSHSELVLLSPTGTGKTLAFLLPIIAELDSENPHTQVLILVPSRELAIQIESVVREMGSGFKANAVYGGRAGAKDKIDLKHLPAILIGTPGRVADHFRRGSIPLDHINCLVLDEFDKSLEVGFENEMKEIIQSLPALKKKILTSATQKLEIPDFVGLTKPITIDYQEEGDSQLKIKIVNSPSKDKLDTLVDTLCHIGNEPGIVFCNFKESISRVSEFLTANKISHGCFHGDMEQIDRERALIKFRNGTHQLIIATDLAARGLDIPELGFIIHYQLPNREHEFIHRNGRTARMHQGGTAYIIKWEEERLSEFIKNAETVSLKEAPIPLPSKWKTLYITGGRRDKISKGDIAGFLFKQAELNKEEVGVIDVKQDFSFVAVKASKANRIVQALNNTRLKKKKVRISLI